MAEFYVNGRKTACDKNIPLMELLRDELRLTSVKDGCSEGACGSCTVIIDGETKKACAVRTDRLEGKSIITCEGLSERERSVYAYAFAEAGAVQCGFCIPGMVMCAKALIDKNPSPTRDDVKKAIRNNICRCTGYVKIEKAILGAAEIIRKNRPVKPVKCAGLTGESIPRADAYDKALGSAVYCDDIMLDGMLYGGAKRSEHPRARVLSIDTSRAEALEGVVCVLTAKDIPGNRKIGHLKKDWDVMIPVGGITHYLGDAVALVAAESREILKAALSLISVEYEVLKPVTCPAEAISGDELVHSDGNLLAREHLVRGNADEVIKNSKYSVTTHFSLPFTEHAFLEPECAVAFTENGTVRIISGDQGIYQTRKECSEMLGLDPENVRVTAAFVGGGFGGKEDMSVQHHAALLAFKTGRPVKVRLSRQESILVHPKRHAMEIDYTSACDENGRLTAVKVRIIADTGAYASLGGPVLQRSCTHAAGPYNFDTVDILGEAYYTNNPPAGAFRGFGVTQSCFAAETNLDLLAEKVGISPFEIRYLNAIRPGDTLPNGQIADETTALAETLDAVRAEYDAAKYKGIACAIKNSGLGVGVPDTGRCRLEVRDGKVHSYSSAACIGQGMATVQLQIICEKTGLSPESIVCEPPDTLYSPDSGNTTASRQTLFTGEAAARACAELSAALKSCGSLEALEGRSFYGEYTGVTDRLGSDKPHPVSHIAYSYATHLVTLNENGDIEKVIAAHDVGRAINPLSVEGQIEGGAVMSLGYALSESYPLENCRPKARFGTLGLFRADKTPEIIPLLVGKNRDGLACGAKGIGEIASIPTPAAVTLAYYHKDGILTTKLPMSRK